MPPARRRSGARPEPLDEISLPARAKRLAAYVGRTRSRRTRPRAHWLYQHAWIVTGARFGWWQGAEALEILVAVDKRVQRQWGMGAKSRRVAQRALAEVRAKS